MPKIRCGRFGKEKNLLLLTEIQLGFLSGVRRSYVTIETMLSYVLLCD